MKEKRKNVFKIILEDNTNLDFYNTSCIMEKSWYGANESGDIISIEDYYYFCRRFAAAAGWTEETINDWFGEV